MKDEYLIQEVQLNLTSKHKRPERTLIFFCTVLLFVRGLEFRGLVYEHV